MSNFLAPAVVTETLRHVLTDAAARAVPGAQVTLGRPVAATNGGDDPSVNVFAYQVNPSSAWINADLPTRKPGGAAIRRPQVGLTLGYLLSFRGSAADLEPERLMASCASRLHAQPMLTREVIEQALGDPLEDHALAGADLADQVERVKITPQPLNLEELSKLWSVLFQVPYVLSMAYEASVVLIEEDTEAAAPGLPVRERRIFLQPFRRITIERIESDAGPDHPIHAGGTFHIFGSGLSAERVLVRVAGDVLEPSEITPRALTVDLADWPEPRAGILPLHVVHPVSEDTPHLRFESGVAALTVTPRITDLSFQPAAPDASPVVTLEVDPPIASRQRVRLFLNEVLPGGSPPGAQPLAYVIDAESAPAATASISIPLRDVELQTPGLETRTYLVRVEVDGAQSVLQVDDDEDSETFGRYVGPAMPSATP